MKNDSVILAFYQNDVKQVLVFRLICRLASARARFVRAGSTERRLVFAEKIKTDQRSSYVTVEG